jgi:hypothetical protein
MQADTIFDEMLDISNNIKGGKKVITKPGGTETTIADMIEHRRLQIETRKWVAGKLRPKKYGEKIDHTHAGPDGGPIESKQTIIYSGALAKGDESV